MLKCVVKINHNVTKLSLQWKYTILSRVFHHYVHDNMLNLLSFGANCQVYSVSWPSTGCSPLLWHTLTMYLRECNGTRGCGERKRARDCSSFYRRGAERSLNCGISTGESITHLEARWWARRVRWEHSLMDHCGLWLKKMWTLAGRFMWCKTPLHVLKDIPGCTVCVDESDCVARLWHQWRDWHIEVQLDMLLDSGLLSAAMVLLAFCASGGLLVIKRAQLPPPGLMRGWGTV